MRIFMYRSPAEKESAKKKVKVQLDVDGLLAKLPSKETVVGVSKNDWSILFDPSNVKYSPATRTKPLKVHACCTLLIHKISI